MKAIKAASELEEFFARNPAIPGFSCLAMKDKAQEEILAETAGMTREELLAYWRKRELALRRRIARQRKKNQG